MEFKDYYHILGLEKSAPADDIKKAYRKLARKFHPDVSKEADAESRMKEINEAYAVLSDPEKRSAYDDLGKNYQGGQEFKPPPNWDAGYEFSGADSAEASDFFSQLFGHAARRQQARNQMRGEDHHAKIVIDVLDAFHGADKTITLHGAHLDAQGRVVNQERTLQVKIPPGVRAGQHIRLAAQGGAGLGGGPAGDLFLEVQFQSNARYRVDGSDLYQKLPVTPWEAALGGELEVGTPSGKLSVNIPANSQTGRKLRLKGRGLPAKPQAGDLYLELEVVLPPARNAREREIYQNMAREMAFDPRLAMGD